MLSRISSAFKGERDLGFDSRKKAGSSVLDKIARASKAVQQRNAQAKLKKDRRGSTGQNAFGEVEKSAPEAEWWSGDAGQAAAGPSDPTPFGKLAEEENPQMEWDEDEDWPEDYDYNEWPVGDSGEGGYAAYSNVGAEGGFDVAFNEADVGGGQEDSGRKAQTPTKSSPKASNPPPSNAQAPSAKAPKKKAAAAKASPWGDSSSEDERAPAANEVLATPAKGKSKGKNRGKGKAKGSPSAGASGSQRSPDPLADSDSSDGSEAAPKGRSKGTPSSSSRAPAPAKPRPQAATNRKDPFADSESDEAPKARAPSKPTRSPAASHFSESSTTDTGSGTARPKSRPKTKAKPKSKPGGRPPGAGAKALLDSSDEDSDGGKVMF